MITIVMSAGARSQVMYSFEGTLYIISPWLPISVQTFNVQ